MNFQVIRDKKAKDKYAAQKLREYMGIGSED